MSDDLVKRLREFTVTGHGPTMLESEAANRIEQLTSRVSDLERELVEQSQKWDFDKLISELAAEKALADRLHDVLYTSAFDGKNRASAAYRKVRGL